MGDRSNRNSFSSSGAAVIPSPGFFIGPGLGDNAISAGSSPPSPNGANLISVFMFVLPFSITIAKVVMGSTAGVDGTFANFGIYTTVGNLVLDSGQFSLAVVLNGVVQSNTLAVPVTIPPGVYYYAQAATSLTPTVINISTSLTAGVSTFYNKNQSRIGRATNQLAAGALPATLGAITNLGATGIPSWVLFEA